MVSPLRLQLNSEFLDAYSIHDSFIVWNKSTDTVQVLQGIGCWVFLGLEQGLSNKELLDEYAREFSSAGLRLADLHNTIEKVKVILCRSSTSSSPYREEFSVVFADPVVDKTLEGMRFGLNHLRYQIVTDNIALQNELEHLLSSQTKPYSAEVDCQFVISTESSQTEYSEGSDNFSIACNGTPLVSGLPYQELMPLLMDYIQISNYQSRDYLVATHGAVMVRDGHALILPGISGSGKSTLCAGLIAYGFMCFTDEVAVFDKSGLVQSLQLPIAIKQGSWEILSKAWPDLERQTLWQRPDGRKLKYLVPPVSVLSQPVFQQTLIFPRYDSEVSSAVLNPIAPVEALNQMTLAGYQLKHGFTEEKFGQLVRLSVDTPAYNLSYSSIEHARRAIEPLMSGFQ